MRKLIFTVLCSVLVISMHSQGLKDLLPPGKFIGAAANNPYLENGNNADGYNEAFIRDFNCIVAENVYKMAYVIPNKPADPFNITIADLSQSQLKLVDAMIDTANKYNMKTRGHAFIWHSQAPSWLTTDARSWTKQQIYDFAESYITAFATYCKGRIDEWDVVNEALNDNGNGFRPGTWYDNVGDKQAFIEHCFTVAHAADPDADLFYNDYSIELYKFNPGAIGNSKNGPMLQMVNNMINHGAPINGVGLQSHYISGPGMTDSTFIALEKTIDSLNTLGLNCNMTELDVRICGGTTEDDLIKQQDEYRRLAKVFLENDNCNTMLVWGVTDGTSWIPSTFSGCDDPLLYDAKMKPKRAYYGVKQSLMEASGIFSGPYNFVPPVIPGIIEAENYDYDAYYDKSSGNSGGVYRTDSVDITEGNTGYVVSWTDTSEYLTYTVEVSVSDTFQLDLIGTGNNSQIQLSIDDVPFNEIIVLPLNDYPTKFDTITVDSIILSEGIHKIKLSFLSDSAIIDYVDFSRTDCNGDRNGSAFIDKCDKCTGGNTGVSPCIVRNPYTVMTIPGIVEAENYDEGDNGVTYNDASKGNEGGQYRMDDVDLGAGDNGEIFVGWVAAGEWLEYTVSVEESANYDITARVASGTTGGRFNIQVNGNTVVSSISIPNTGGYTTFIEQVAKNVHLEEGESVIRINMTGSYFNIDYLQFEVSEETGISIHKANNLSVVPNPFKNEIHINGMEADQVWSLYSIDGRLLKEGTSDVISTDELNAGIFIIKVNGENFKMIKQK